jgi:DNA gyrase subunit A
MTDETTPPGGTNPSGGSPHVQPVSIQEEMRSSYLDYAMSVIIGRAIPDARDGLKPVHRRILFAMRGLNLTPGGSFSKCAKVVGEVLGNYHPHGDASVYDALVRMAQDFAMRHVLVDGQGNFGSVDGDAAAAYRYTECRLARLAMELLTDIDKETVDFGPNFDESRQEPLVLPARFPHLLVNGSGGIAVGMATNIPPHNLREIIDATIHLIANPDATVEDLMRFVQGPDFPTGGIIHGRAGIHQAYTTGRGSVMMRARTEVEKVQGSEGREQIVVTEIPYQVNKARLAAKIGELIREKRVEGIREVRDESDRDGMRLVIELKKDAFPQVVQNQLFRLTDLQTSFGIINLAIVHARPKTMTLKETLEVFVEHRREVVSRRTRYELSRAEAAREIVEGLGMAVTEVDLVIRTIRSSRDPDAAREALMNLPLRGLEEFVRRAGRPEDEIRAASERSDYRLSERQAKAILEMRLSRLTGLEQEKLAQEYGELCAEIAHLRAILASEALLMELIVGELHEVAEKHGEERRTAIEDNEAEIAIEDLIAPEDMVVTISHSGYIKRTAASSYEAQKRGGKGKRGMLAQDADWVSQLFIASTHAYVFFFSDLGKVYVRKVFQVPQAAPNAKGRAIVNFIGLEEGERIAAIAPVSAIEDGRYVITITKSGKIKKTPLLDYKNFREKGIIGVRIEDDDLLLTAAITDGTRDLLIGTRLGQCIRFNEAQVRPMGRNTAGVKGVELEEGDQVVGLAVSDDERTQVLSVCERGFGKRTPLDDFRVQNRGGKGIILIDASDRNGPVVGIALVKEDDDLILMTDQGQTLRTRVEGVRETGRNAQGVRLMNVADDERIVAIETVAEREEGNGGSLIPGSIAPGSLLPDGLSSDSLMPSASMDPPADGEQAESEEAEPDGGEEG